MNPIQKVDWVLDHIGIAVNDVNTAAADYLKLGYRKVHEEVLDSQAVAVLFLTIGPDDGSAELELISPLGPTGPLTKFLASRGPGLHHLCYRVKDIAAELERLERAGTQLIDRTPRPGARGHQIAFLHPKATNGILIELCQ